ncbi:MAG: phosphatase PAP2 family protein, partial [Mangrovicoccus sp.]
PIVAKPLMRIRRPSNEYLSKAAKLVDNYVDLRDERNVEINIQIEDILSFFGMVTPLHGTSYRWTLELLDVAMDVASALVQSVKLDLGCPRPELFSPSLQPIIQTPSHGTFPSGHSTQAFTVASLLYCLRFASKNPDMDNEFCVSEDETRLMKIANRIAVNRTVAGVHFPVDSAAGAMLGITLGRTLYRIATGAPDMVQGRNFDAAQYMLAGQDGLSDQPRDFNLLELSELMKAEGPASATPEDMAEQIAPRTSMILKLLWEKADEEWKGRWG